MCAPWKNVGEERRASAILLYGAMHASERRNEQTLQLSMFKTSVERKSVELSRNFDSLVCFNAREVKRWQVKFTGCGSGFLS